MRKSCEPVSDASGTPEIVNRDVQDLHSEIRRQVKTLADHTKLPSVDWKKARQEAQKQKVRLNREGI